MPEEETEMQVLFKTQSSQAWWCMLIIPALTRPRKEHQEFTARGWRDSSGVKNVSCLVWFSEHLLGN